MNTYFVKPYFITYSRKITYTSFELLKMWSPFFEFTKCEETYYFLKIIKLEAGERNRTLDKNSTADVV